MEEQGGGAVDDGMRIDRDVPVPMPDGVVLRADVFRPEAPASRGPPPHAAATVCRMCARMFTRFVRDDVAKWAKVVDFAQVRAE